MSNHKNRLDKLETRQPSQAQATPAQMKPSEILRRADELIAAGATPDQEQARRLEALRRMVNHEQP